jgi:hypothetical protein
VTLPFSFNISKIIDAFIMIKGATSQVCFS